MNKRKEKELKKAFSKLRKLYTSIPDTKGCMEHISKPKEEGGCGGRCCQFINPHLMRVEFLHTWQNVLRTWSLDKIADLVERAINNYLSSRPTKGCIFWDRETKLCQIHTVRPQTCRTYGITPEEEMQPRIERLRILYKDRIDAVIDDQCKLVSTANGEKVTTKDTNDWWKQLVDIEESIGVDKKDIRDGSGGSYMTYHDHILLHIMPDFIMKQLQILRTEGEEHEKRRVVEGIMAGCRKKLQEAQKVSNEKEKSSE